MKRFALALLIGGSVAMAAPASAQVIFSMDYSAAAAPNGGWSAVAVDPHFTRTRVAGGGPNGQDAYELQQLSVPSLASYGGQFNWGWRGNVESVDPGQGERRYIRWRMRFSPNTNFRGLGWGDGGQGGVQNKLLIVGDTCGSRCRFIMTYQADRNTGVVRNFRLQLDGGVDVADTGSYPVGQWLNIQVELDSGSGSTSADGGYKIWINNNNYGSPTAQRTGIVLRPTNWKYVFIGGFMNDGLAADGVHIYRQTDFQVARSFDAGWASGGGGSTPPPPPQTLAAPSNVRIIVP
jgi:hypothetical protein